MLARGNRTLQCSTLGGEDGIYISSTPSLVSAWQQDMEEVLNLLKFAHNKLCKNVKIPIIV